MIRNRIVMGLIAVALIAAMTVMPAAATTWTVCSAGCDFTDIDAATEKNGALADGDTVFVYNGSYSYTGTDIVAIWPRITLKGEGADVVTWDAGGYRLELHGAGTIIEGLKIVNSDKGVDLTAPDCIIRNCVFEGITFMYGIPINSLNTTFRDSVVTGATGAYGAIQPCGGSCTIVNNTLINNTGAGILLYPSTAANNTITKNNLSSNGKGFFLYNAGEGNKIYLNDVINTPNVAYGGTPPSSIYWNSTELIEYTYGGTEYTNYLGNYWGNDYTNGDAGGDGIGDTPYDIPGSATDKDYRPLMAGFENYLGAPAAESPHLVTYTISNRTIIPPQTTEIDVEFSETVSYKIAIENDTVTIYDWTGTAKNPDPKVWAGTYEVNGTVVPDGDYTVNVTGTNTTTGLRVVNNTEVITVMSTPEQPDLFVTAINAYHNNTGSAAWFNLSNEIDVTVTNNGTGTAGASNVSLRIDDELFGTLPVSSLAAGASETVTFEGWMPVGEDCLQEPCEFAWSLREYNLIGVAYCDGAVSESDETNNEATVVETACYNGYMADEPLENVAHGMLHGMLQFTTGDGTYTGLYSVGSTQTTNYELSLPAGATVDLAHLNVYYTWHYEKESCPQIEVSITNATGTYVVPLKKAYNDIKCMCPGAAWVFPWGNYVYDLTDYIQGSSTYTVTVERTGGPSVCVAAPGLAVLYEDANAPPIEYWLNEGADVLIGGRRSDGGYLAWWECINNATFPASAGTEEVVNATLGVVAPWAGSAWEPGMTNYLFFNGVQLGTGVYHGFGETYDETLDSISLHIGSTNAQVGVNVTSVTSLYQQGSENSAGQADDGDNIMTANAFLVVEYAEEAVVPWQGYLVPQNSTGSYGGDTAVELWVKYNDTGLTRGAVAYQVDVHFDPSCVNITSADFSTSPFHGTKMFVPYASGIVRLSEDNYGSGAISPGTYKLATLTLHGESPTSCACDVWFDGNIVSDTDGEPIVNIYTDGTYTCAGVAEPDLIVTGITPNCGYLFANETNEISATIKNNGTADVGAFNVSFVLDGFSAKVSVSALGAGNDTEVSITDPTLRYAGATVSITVTADCDGAIAESNETNNASALTASVMNSGYKGKRYTGGEDIKTVQTDRLNGNLLYSVGGSKYLSGSATAWYTYSANWTASDLPVPGDASIEKARLYVMYTWDKVQGMPDNVSMSFNDLAQTRDAFYTDRKEFGSSNYPYGMLVYNVTGDFNTSGNTAVLENLNPVAGNPSMRGMLLVVVYAEQSEPERTIVVNEEFDLLYGGTAQCTTPEEATAYAPFGAAIDLTDVEKATLIIVAPGAGPNEGELIFNGQTWTDVWNYAGNSQIGIDNRDVTAYLDTTNEAEFQSSADYMEASNAFLVVTYKMPGAAPTADSFGVEDASYAQVPVNITNVRNGPVQGIRCRMDYNESVLNLTSIGNGDLTANWTAIRLGVDRHTITVATAYTGDAIPNGSSGSVVLLNFHVIGSPGETSPMNTTLIELSNPDGIVGTAPAKNGTFVVPRFGSIAGRITYACNGTGIAGVVLNLTNESIVNSTVTNETGYYNFTDVIPDSYVVNASKSRLWDNSTEITVIASEIITADMMLWLKGDSNNDGNVADAGDVVLMLRASVGDIPGDMRYDLNGNGEIGDAGDVVLMLRASVGDIELL